MPSAEVLLAFFLATAVFAYMPGPAMLYAAARTIAGGRRAGLSAALGIHIGGYLHVVAAAAGVSILFQAAPTAFLAMKVIGAAYLIWLGVNLFRKPKGDFEAAERPARRAFLESVAVEAFNPKTALFFLAFLPQFADPAASLPLWAQLLVLGTIVNFMFSSADLVCVAMASLVVQRMRQSAFAQRIVRAIGGSILIALGLKLAFDDR